MKQHILWGIADYEGRIMPFVLGRTRRDAIGSMEEATGEPWKKLRRYGYSAIRVKVEPAETAP